MHKILRALILSDLFILGSFGLIQPIFAVFMLSEITGVNLTAIGVATAIQLVTKGVFQIAVGKWTDEERGNKRELAAMFVGSALMTLVPIGYAFSSAITHIYLLQFVYGLGSALVYPGWVVVFMRYTRENNAGYEWGVYNTVISFGSAAAAFLGANLAETYSFFALFIVVSLLSLVGTSFILHIFKHEFMSTKHKRHVINN